MEKLSFKESFDQWLENQPHVVEAPIEHGCGMPHLPSTPEIGFEYCDGLYHYRMIPKGTDRQVIIDNEKQTYPAPYPTLGVSGRCPVPGRIKQQAVVQKIKSEYITLDGSPMGWELFDPAMESDASRYMREFTGAGKVILGGPTGRGKTHIARATYVALLASWKNPAWVTAAKLQRIFLEMQSWAKDPLEHLQATKYYESLVASDCLFIDDLGDERITDSEIFLQEFKALLEKHQGGLVITTNNDSAEIMKRYGEKIHSRLFANMKTFMLTGEDYRKRTFPKLKTNA